MNYNRILKRHSNLLRDKRSLISNYATVSRDTYSDIALHEKIVKLIREYRKEMLGVVLKNIMVAVFMIFIDIMIFSVFPYEDSMYYYKIWFSNFFGWLLSVWGFSAFYFLNRPPGIFDLEFDIEHYNSEYEIIEKYRKQTHQSS